MDPTDALAIANGHPPEAAGVVCVDFDGVLYPFCGLMDAPAPIPGAVDAMRALRAAGFRIVIWTSRLSDLWLTASGNLWMDQVDYIAGLLDRDGIAYDLITAEKVAAIAYIDDHAIRFERSPLAFQNVAEWQRIVDELT